MTRRTMILLAASGSCVLLVAAFVFQALGWPPCTMCLWQRWPHAAAIVFGAIGFAYPSASIALGGALSAAATSAIAAFHSGVELKWWQGPAACSQGGEGLAGLSGADLLPGGADAPALVMCDTLTPFFLGLTMANWNLLASAMLCAVWVAAVLRRNTG